MKLMYLVAITLTANTVSFTPGASQERPPDEAFTNTTIEINNADREVLTQLQRNIESLPEAERTRIGAEIIRSHLNAFESATLRQRVLLSLGELYYMEREYDESIGFYQQAVEANADRALTTLATRRRADVLSAKGDTDGALGLLAQSTPAHVPNGLNPEEPEARFLLEEKQIDVLYKAGQCKEGFALAIELAKRYPERRTQCIRMAEKLASACVTSGRVADALHMYDALALALPEATADPIFESNRIQLLLNDGQREQVAAASERFVQRFPDYELAASYHFILGAYYESVGRPSDAIRAFEAVVAHPEATDEYRVLARNNIGGIRERTIRRETPISDGESRRGQYYVYLVTANVVVIALLVVCLIFRAAAGKG